MYKEYPEFLYDGKLTEAGQKVVAYIEAKLDKALSLTEGTQDVASLNALSGPFKDYYVNVRCMTYYQHKPEGWVKDRRAAVTAIWEQMKLEEEAAATAAAVQQQQQTSGDIVARLDRFEKALADLMTLIKPAAPAAEAEKEEEDAEPEAAAEEAPKKVGRPKKAKPEASETPAADDAEGDADKAE